MFETQIEILAQDSDNDRFQLTADAVYSDVILAFGQKHYVLYWCLKEAAL